MDRHQLRQELRARRAAAAALQPDAAGKLLIQFQTITILADAICAGYIAIRNEIDPVRVMEFLAQQGASLSLPVVLDETQPLIFRDYKISDELRDDNAFKIPEPAADKNIAQPTIILVPLLGFDRTGHRMGSGKGLYDRTLHGLRKTRNIIAIGLAYAEQEVPQIPAENHDERLNIIVTPDEVIYCPVP